MQQRDAGPQPKQMKIDGVTRNINKARAKIADLEKKSEDLEVQVQINKLEEELASLEKELNRLEVNSE